MDQVVKAGCVRLKVAGTCNSSYCRSYFFSFFFLVLVGEGLGSLAYSSSRLFSAPSEYGSQLRLPFSSDKLLYSPVVSAGSRQHPCMGRGGLTG